MRPTRKQRSIRLLCATFISCQILLEPLASRAAVTPRDSLIQISQKEVDPIWQEFVDAKPTGFKLSFSLKDPSLDRDPFFLRSQSWANSSKLSSDLGFIKTQGGVEIAFPNSHRILRLNLPLTPIQATDDFVFFSLDSSSDLFQKVAGPNEKPGEGLFFISRRDLVQQTLDNKAVPVFFFPLAGTGWTGPLKSLEMSQIESLVIANQTESVALELKDVETVMKVQQMNLSMALSRTQKNRGPSNGRLLPAPGMTAAFGMFFTGMDLENPHKSVWAPQETFPKWAHFFETTISKIASFVSASLVKEARAMDLSPELIDRLQYVGSILGGMLMASVIIKYKHPAIRKKLEALRDPAKPAGPLKELVKESFHVFAAMTSTAAQISSVTFANSLELFLDKFAPTVAAADHTLVRRILSNSFYFSRNSIKGVPVNEKTFVLGALVIGSVDTGLMQIQYNDAVPAIANAMAPHLSESMQERIEVNLSPNNPETSKIILQDTVRNALAYLQSGAASYSIEAKQQVFETATKEAEVELQSQGIDPRDPKNKSKIDDIVKDKVARALKQKGLPGDNHFLFDMNTVYFSAPKALGYKAPEDLQAQESFILATRYGLSKNALKRALQAAEEWQRLSPSPEAKEAVAILKETLGSMRFLINGVKRGTEGLQKARQVRQQLTALSYEGSINYVVKYIPEIWSERFSSQGTQVAALLFRQALYSYLVREGEELLLAKNQKTERFGRQALKTASDEVRKAYPELASLNDEALLKNKKVELELKLRTQIQIIELARQWEVADKADKFEGPKQDWLERRKHRRALQEAEEKVKVYIAASRGASFSDEKIFELKKSYFTKALARQVGLHIENPDLFDDGTGNKRRTDYAEMLEVVEKKAQERTQGQIKNDPNLARWLEKSSPEARAQFEMSLYANNYMQGYVSSTTADEMVSATDPAQPGRFQKIRQTQVVRKSAFLTRTLRVLEAFGADQVVSAGVSGSLARNIPLYQDLLNSHKRLFKVMWSALTVGYVWNYFAWQVHMPYASMLLFVATSAATIMTPGQWVDRTFRMQGVKPNESILAKAAYGVPYSWATFLGMIPLLLFTNDVNILFSDYVRDPFLSTFGAIPKEAWLTGAAGLGLTLAAVKSGVKTKLTEKTQSLKGFLSGNMAVPAIRCEQVFQP